MAEHETDRSAEIKAIHREYRFFYQVLGGAILVGIGVLIGAVWFSSDVDRSAYIVNLYTSILSIIVTVFVIDLLNRRRDDRNALRQLQEQLIRDAGRTSNEIAKNAVHQLNIRDWLDRHSGALKKANLRGANLAGANLSGANLRGTDLFMANLQGTDLGGAKLEGAKLDHANLKEADLYGAKLQGSQLSSVNLQEAILGIANLQGANLRGANLQRANLRDANLQEADLYGAKLQGADLWGANLKAAKIHGINLDKTTMLPDETYWTPDTDMRKFGCIVEESAAGG
jgi:uncharacterized protein YjbI with pentapeptide repeats